jgi:hypothetical protein
MINSSPHIWEALARERRNTFLLEAQANQLAKQVRFHRQQRARGGGARRPPHRGIPGWLASAWSGRRSNESPLRPRASGSCCAAGQR